MPTDLKAQVYPILDLGIALWEARAKGSKPRIGIEQAALIAELNKKELREIDESLNAPSDEELSRQSEGIPSIADKRFLGFRYVLAVWIDEILIGGDDQEEAMDEWSREWNEKKLETALFNSNYRAVIFPLQANWLLRQKDYDEALQVYFLCVMLGFGGQWDRELTSQIVVLEKDKWVEAAREQIVRGLDRQQLKIQALEPPAAFTPPLLWHDRLGQMGLVAAGTSLALLLLAVILFVWNSQ
jgi:type VI protein secretion system component VasF